MAVEARRLRARAGGFRLYVEELRADSLVVVLGRNGSGKTTLLKALAGLIKAEGEVEACGRDVSRMPPEERGLVYIPSTPPEISVTPRRFLAMVAARHGALGELRWLAAEVGLEGVLDRRGLSTGQRQLVAIAAALLAKPCALLLDEPTSHLDLANKRKIIEVVSKLEVTRIYVTHDVAEALALKAPTYVMDGGSLRGPVEAGGGGELMDELAAAAGAYGLL